MTVLERILSVFEPESFGGLLDLMAVFGEAEEVGEFVERLEGSCPQSM